MRSTGRLALAAAALSSACAATHRPPGPSSVTATVVRTSTQCGGEASGPSARWIGTAGAFHAAMGAGGTFGSEMGTPDFRKEGVLALFMGQRPTAGYGLALHDPTVAIANRVATVVVRVEEPQPGAMVAQVLTSPCLLIRMPRQGIQQIRVVDPSGAQIATANVGVPPEMRERQPGYPPR
jgi:hypothetical protein